MVSAACSVPSVTADQGLIERVCNIDNTPVLSGHYQRLSQISVAEPADLVQLATVIEERPALASNLIKLANSAYYAPAAKVDSVNAVIEVMGVTGTLDMALALELVKTFGLPKSIDIERFWDHSVAVATLSKELATRNRLDGKTAYSLGLLHDVGLLLMARFAPSEFGILMRQLGPQGTLFEMVPRVHGISHFDLSIALIERWGFDSRLCEPLRIIEAKNGDRGAEIFRLSLLLRQAHAIAHENRYAFSWDRLPEVAPKARLESRKQYDFASGVGAALLACCYK